MIKSFPLQNQALLFTIVISETYILWQHVGDKKKIEKNKRVQLTFMQPIFFSVNFFQVLNAPVSFQGEKNVGDNTIKNAVSSEVPFILLVVNKGVCIEPNKYRTKWFYYYEVLSHVKILLLSLCFLWLLVAMHVVL